jgi:hypothetical protein
VQRDNGCIEFTGRNGNSKGYGLISVGAKGEGQVYVHRVAWELANGPIPPNTNVLHSCDNPPCCNPEHLYLGTKSDNTRDMMLKGRGSRKLTPEQVATMRALYAAGGVRQKDLAVQFDSNVNTVNKILTGKLYTY